MTKSNFTIASIRARITDARVAYVGSITIDHRFCDAVGLVNRQLVQVRNERTARCIDTYVIYGRICDAVLPSTICVNGAAAHFFQEGDIVCINAFAMIPMGQLPPKIRTLDTVTNPIADDIVKISMPHSITSWSSNASIPIALGKVHRARITAINGVQHDNVSQPIIVVDEEWLSSAGILSQSVVHLVNTTSGQRDVLTVEAAAAKSKSCELRVHPDGLNALLQGYNVGDVVIIMRYCLVSRNDLVIGLAPPMKICFPFEMPIDKGEKSLNHSWLWSTHVLWDESKLAYGLIKFLKLKTPGKKILDCSCGNGFPGAKLRQMGIPIVMSDGCEEAVVEARRQFLQATREEPNPGDIRCVHWDRLPQEYGKESFDVILLRGDSLPYVNGNWSAPSLGDGSNSTDSISKLITSMHAIFDTLSSGGVLYIDCMAPHDGTIVDVNINKQAYILDNSAEVSVQFKFTVDMKRRARRFESWVKVLAQSTGEVINMHNDTWGLFVGEQGLRSILLQVGFGPVFKINVDGESVYQPFIAFKPDPLKKRMVDVHDKVMRTMNFDFLSTRAKIERFVWGTETDRSFGMFPEKGAEHHAGSFSPPTVQSAQESLLSCMVNKVKQVNDVTTFLNIVSHDSMKGDAETKMKRLFPAMKPSFISSEKITDLQGSFDVCIGIDALNGLASVPRMKVLGTLVSRIEENGYVVLCEAISGRRVISPATHLHFVKKRCYEDLWTMGTWMNELESVGLAVRETYDISEELNKFYKLILSVVFSMINGSSSMKVDDKGYDIRTTMAVDIEETLNGIRENEIGLALIVCKRIN